MSSPIPVTSLAEIKDAIFRGNKIEAIKILREATGSDLKDSKDSVEKLEAELRVSEPGRFAAKSAGGCAAVLLLAVTVAFAAFCRP